MHVSIYVNYTLYVASGGLEFLRMLLIIDLALLGCLIAAAGVALVLFPRVRFLGVGSVRDLLDLCLFCA